MIFITQIYPGIDQGYNQDSVDRGSVLYSALDYLHL